MYLIVHSLNITVISFSILIKFGLMIHQFLLKIHFINNIKINNYSLKTVIINGEIKYSVASPDATHIKPK